MKAYIESYGCTLNKGEASLIEESLSRKGFEFVEKPESADTILIATCAVIETTENHMLKRIRELAALNKELYVSGCLALWKEKEIEELGATPITRLNFEDLLNESIGVDMDGGAGIKRTGIKKISIERIGVIPISTGCVGNCSYCVTKVIRGSLKSYEPELLVEKAKDLIRNGTKEIRITAQDTACYGFDKKELYLPELIERIASLDGEFRVRVGMMTPNNYLRIEKELLSSFASKKIYKFFHLPLQSADDEILKAMHRAYTFEEYVGAMERIRESFEYSTIATDIITGFPMESWQSFMKTYRAMESLKADVVNITRFSPRYGTEAFSWKRPLSRNVKTRSRMLTKLCRDIAVEINKNFTGKIVEALTCEGGKGNTVMARSNSYKPIVIPAMELGKFIRVKIVDANGIYLKGVTMM
jgi:MiaB-like tRNA modifying enzyme